MYRVRSAVCGAALLVTLSLAGPAHADPADPAGPADPVGDTQVDVVVPPLPGPDAGGSVAQACRLFDAAVNVAAANYEDFAYATAGTGDYVNYDDPTVQRANVVGRAALRAAAGTALDAAHTPGLPPEVADPMQSWSLHATKLMVVMGLRGGGNQLNSSATELNSDATAAQTACALALARR